MACGWRTSRPIFDRTRATSTSRSTVSSGLKTFFTACFAFHAAFLSGTFYSAERLPPFWQGVAHANPLFYMIDGFRFGFIGHADGSLTAGILVLLGANAILLWLTHRLFAIGYHLKA